MGSREKNSTSIRPGIAHQRIQPSRLAAGAAGDLGVRRGRGNRLRVPPTGTRKTYHCESVPVDRTRLGTSTTSRERYAALDPACKAAYLPPDYDPNDLGLASACDYASARSASGDDGTPTALSAASTRAPRPC